MYTNSKIQKSNSNFQNLIILICVFLIGISANAQCAMCRAALSGDSNVKKAEAVNDGIVYLMVIPYLLVVIIGYLIYRMYQKKKAV
ncbi:hypothetical protein HYN56_08695 [Flavobacterium crocinum]|uniref:Uncharacterized protein n=1 Tax=Flavobacterium crocinum TaxID=2183896 RepID=A0A2S1YJR1_9FLAO|nr:hypothetical protein [Flavobacterium crocinum]AWK04309.1 hypothetical protein HYN56_08695 [Flavobacterium crocinum]